MKEHMPEGAGPCVKAHVKATLVTQDGQQFSSTNYCLSPQPECPRVVWGFAPGQGYHLCEQVCRQPAHAEVNALAFAEAKVGKKALIGSTVYVEYEDKTGTTKPWICHACSAVCKSCGVEHKLGKPPEASTAHSQRQWGAYQASRKAILGETV